MNKYTYLKVIQQYTGPQYGWEDVVAHECNASGCFKTPADRKAYSENHKAYRTEQTLPVRAIFRRELN